MRLIRIVTVGAVIVTAAWISITAGVHYKSTVAPPPVKQLHLTLPTAPEAYLGVYTAPSPGSFTGVIKFTNFTSVRPNLDMYYSGWLEPFQLDFATEAARHGAIPLVQIDPTDISMASIASGDYDNYLDDFANAVRSYGHPVIIGFGHEMNGNWYSWAYRHASPTMFVAAWRHIVTLFRTLGAENVTWLWTINVITKEGSIAHPGPWWPGNSYVNWVGIDGYYGKSSTAFTSLFGPTIVAIRSLTNAPIIIAETGVVHSGRQSAQITDLFAGIHTYGLLGLVWFDAIGNQDWRIITPSAVSAFRQGAAIYHRI